jgi:Asp/Glu/hydantoin racemase
VGVIAILRKSLARHGRMFGALGLSSRVAAELPLDMNVVDLSDESRTKARLLEVGRRLRDEHAADVLVLGCAGMAAYRGWLQQELGVAVVEPTQAGTAAAIGRVLLGW